MYKMSRLIGRTVTIQPYCETREITGKLTAYESGGYFTLILPDGSRFRTGAHLIK